MNNYVAALVDELYELGVREVVISPGSRSTPLAISFCEHKFKTFINIDERSSGFFALGIAKEHKRPVVLVCTSGSAVANYFPAIVEAKYSRVPLIILTADRPHELREVGAPQTIDQNKIFSGYVTYYEELALAEEREEMYRYVRVTMQNAYSHAMSNGYSVAHVNVPLRDPLIPDLDKLDFSLGRSHERFELIRLESCGQKPVFSFDDSVLANKNGVIICGGDAYVDYYDEVLELAKRLKAPILADPISNFRNYAEDFIVDSYDAFLKDDIVKKELKPEFIIHFGQVLISKRLNQFLAMHRDAMYFQVDEVFEYRNPSLSINKFVVSSPKLFAQSVQIENTDDSYLKLWQAYQRKMRKQLNAAADERGLFEGKLVQMLQNMLPEETRLMAANSMSIRDIDYFFEAREQNIKVFGNRGANGIDGLNSTALGIATCNKPTVLVTGDLAFYHDLNGLLIGKKHGLNLVIVLFNNNGGGIFRYLPQSKEDCFENLFLTPHGIDFHGLETLYGITYYQPQDYNAFEIAFKEAIALEGIKLIEVKIDLETSKALHDKYTILRKIKRT